MKIPNSIKIILSFFATIILGAIGSGVWEKVLSPLLSYLSKGVTSTLSSLSSTYADSIYARASDLHAPYSSDKVGIILLLVVCSGLFVYALNSKKESRLATFLHEVITTQFQGWYGIISSGSILIVLLFMLTSQSTVERIKGYSQKQMEILRPYIGEKKYFQMRSDYLRIRNKKDFEQFWNTYMTQQNLPR